MRAASDRPTSTPCAAACSMSAADGIGRRAVLGAGAWIGLGGFTFGAGDAADGVTAPDGFYRSRENVLVAHPLRSFPGIRYGRADRFREIGRASCRERVCQYV